MSAEQSGALDFSFWPFWRRSVPLVMQSESAECGIACLAMIFRHHGFDVGMPVLRAKFGDTSRGVSLGRMVDVATECNFNVRPIRAELEYLKEVQTPFIAHWNFNHFVVVTSVDGDRIGVNDPAAGTTVISMAEAGECFTGVLLEMEPSERFERRVERARLGLMDIMRAMRGAWSAIAQLLVLALLIEVIGLLIPFQYGLIIDRVIGGGESTLLVSIAGVFLTVTLLHAFLLVLRGWLAGWLSASLSYKWTVSLFGHLLTLPVAYFERRSMGDVLSRFGSAHAVQETLSASFVLTALDGLVGVLALLILVWISPGLACIVVGASAVYAAVRWATSSALWRANEERINYDARQQTELLESVRGIKAIKLAGKEAQRQARVSNATMEGSRRMMLAQYISAALSGANTGIFGWQRVMVLAFGAYAVTLGSMTAGMLIAFVAYADQFVSRFFSFIDRITELRLLGLHVDRISEIALEPSEFVGSHDAPMAELSHSGIALKSLYFKYAKDDPWLFEDFNLEVEAGECVAITGPSGCGKTTLAKMVLGLLDPSHGWVEVGGRRLSELNGRSYRMAIAAVLQDDQLFSGSIAENIAFFDPDASRSDIERAAVLAQIHGDVATMPMGYETLVGDMGSSLSGGQKQRILLARALYRKPRILILDEATSHLDVQNEIKIGDVVGSMNITRIVIAHRKETIDRADRVVDLSRVVSARAKVGATESLATIS